MSLEQQMEALAKAQAVRTARGALKRRLRDRADELTAAMVLADVPAEAMTMPILELLRCQWRWGKERSLHTLRAAGIPEMKRLGELTPRQRSVLLRHIA